MAQVFPINETDLYYFILVNCMGSGAVRHATPLNPNRFHARTSPRHLCIILFYFIYLLYKCRTR
jgi:hypothetical protein